MYYAVGDIHGHFDLVKKLYTEMLRHIELSGDRDNVIVFLGDYIDRGKQNRQTLDFLMGLENFPGVEHVFLRGNHEDIFTEAMEFPRNLYARRMWVENGGQAFLNEMKMDFDYFNNTFPWHQYVRWFKYRTEHWYETEDYVFVHGGLDIRVSDMKAQDKDSLLWARHTKKDAYQSFHKMVIHGHTPQTDPQVDINRINVDTSWSYSKYPNRKLTAVALPTMNYPGMVPHFIQVE